MENDARIVLAFPQEEAGSSLSSSIYPEIPRPVWLAFTLVPCPLERVATDLAKRRVRCYGLQSVLVKHVAPAFLAALSHGDQIIPRIVELLIRKIASEGVLESH